MTETLPKCYTVQDVAAALKLSENSVRRIFQDREGVIKFKKGRRLTRGKKEYTTLRITAPALERFLAESTSTKW